MTEYKYFVGEWFGVLSKQGKSWAYRGWTNNCRFHVLYCRLILLEMANRVNGFWPPGVHRVR